MSPWCILVLVFVHCVSAMIETKPILIDAQEHFTIVWFFQFAKDGELNMSIIMDDTESMKRSNTSLQFMLCTESQVLLMLFLV
eukprot:g65318.t1